MQNANIQFRFINFFFHKTIHDAIVNYDLHDGKAIVEYKNNSKQEHIIKKNINT